MTDYFFLPFTFVFSFVICRLVIHLSRKHFWLDHPNTRSSHASPTPTGGGIGIVLSFVLAALFAFTPVGLGFNHYLILFLSVLIASIGLLDDLLSLGIWSRITVQFLAVAGALAMLGIPSLQVFSILYIPGVVASVFAAFCFLWFINLFNFMDGIDGLAATETLFICTVLFLLTHVAGQTELAMFILLLLAAVTGFLLLNLAPAKIFMGDTGSNFIGYLLGVIALVCTAKGITSLWTCLILAGVFIVDASVTLGYRILKGETLHHAHRCHAYQRATDRLDSHGKVVIATTLINLFWLFPLAMVAHWFPVYGLPLTGLSWMPLALIVWHLERQAIVPGTP